MTATFYKIIYFSLIPVFTLILGSMIVLIRRPNGNIRSLILHFAAGVIFSVVSVELLPDLIKTHAPIPLVLGFTFGFALMIFIRKFTEAKENDNSKNINIPYGILLAVAVDLSIDGLLLGIGFTAGEKEGILLSVALGLELLSLGMATSTELQERGAGKKQVIITAIVLAAIFLASAFLGFMVLQNVSHLTLEVILSFGLSALLFLVTEELLVEAHEEKETVWHTTAFFGGFLLFMVLGMITF